jgi:hypothetical protein
VPVEQPPVGRQRPCIAGGRAEPAVPAARLAEAIAPGDVERLRPLLPVGYPAGVRAYRAATAELTADDLSEHYTRGLAWFHDAFAPRLRATLTALTGGAWDLSRHRAFAAGSDVDMMAHVVEAVAQTGRVTLYPGDWFGFRVGSARPDAIAWSATGGGLACLCVPSVRNGHITEEMAAFLEGGEAALLNLNLLPTLTAAERVAVAARLAPIVPRALLSISFSRGFGLTASQLGVLLAPEDHPLVRRFETQWNWFTYFYNAIAARAFLALDLAELAAVDDARRAWVRRWLTERGLPALDTGSYYVRAFRAEGAVADHLAPLCRDGVVRLCCKPPADPR